VLLQYATINVGACVVRTTAFRAAPQSMRDKIINYVNVELGCMRMGITIAKENNRKMKTVGITHFLQIKLHRNRQHR
jgi:hypothetical protein